MSFVAGSASAGNTAGGLTRERRGSGPRTLVRSWYGFSPWAPDSLPEASLELEDFLPDHFIKEPS